MNGSAVRAVARHEWARRGRSLLLIGLVAGLLGGLIVAGAGLARRTATAPGRLQEAVAPGDALVDVFGDPGAADDLVALPDVERSWPAQLSVAQLDGPAVTYLGITAGPPRPEGLLAPVIVEGRAADPDRADEVVILEDAAAKLGVGPGSRLRLSLLTAEEVRQFDVGFGEPDGPTVDLVVTGIGRVPAGVLASSPVLATPAFSEQYGSSAAGTTVYVDLRDGPSGYPAFEEEVQRIAASLEAAPGAEEFAPLAVSDPRVGTAEARSSARVLVGGLSVAVLVATLAGLLALGQALARHHSGSAPDQVVERALGMARTERTLARVIPAGAAATVAGIAALAVALAGASVEPPGAVGGLEPHAGWRLDALALGIGVSAVVGSVLALAAVTAWRAGPSTRTAASSEATSGLRFVPWRSGWALAGSSFALSNGGRRRPVPVRSSLVGAVLGVAGLVVGLTFGASLDRLVATPERWGWTADLMVVDATDEIDAELAADPRIASVTPMLTSSVQLEGAEVQAHSATSGDSQAAWTFLDGRPPTEVREIALGTRVADRIGADVGDTVLVGDEQARVVGVGLGPPINKEGLGGSVLLSPEGLEAVAVRQQLRDTLVTAAPDADPAALAEDLGSRYELDVRSLPPAVAELDDLGALPELLGAFLAVLGALALVHALVVTTRRRARDLAVLRALGSTPAQAAAAVLAMAMTTAAVGVALGVPLGWATARLIWGEVARSTGVAADITVPGSVAVVLVAALLTAALLALMPARKVARARPAEVLRSE